MAKILGLLMVLAILGTVLISCTGATSTSTPIIVVPSPVTGKPTVGPPTVVTRAPAPATIITKQPPRARTAEELASLPLGPERQQILEQGARQEEEVMIYTSGTGLEVITRDFMRKYPFVKVDVFTTRVPALIERVTAETRAGRLGADVASGPLTLHTPLQVLTVKFNSPNAEFNVAPKAAAFGVGLVVFTYSTKRVKPAEVPTKVEDLLNPRWKGKLGLFAPPNTFPGLWVNMLMETLGETKARDFLSKLSGQDLFFYDSPQIGEKALTDAQIDINMQGSSTARLKIGEGLPLNWTAPEPTMGYVSLTALFKDAKHPHAALLWIDYILSPEAESEISRAGWFTNREVASGEIDGIKLPKTIWLQTPERVRQIPQGTKLFEQLVMRK